MSNCKKTLHAHLKLLLIATFLWQPLDAGLKFSSVSSSVLLEPNATFQVSRPSMVTGFSDLSIVRNFSSSMNTWSGGYQANDILAYDDTNPQHIVAPDHLLAGQSIPEELDRDWYVDNSVITLNKDTDLLASLDVYNSCTIIGNGHTLDLSQGMLSIKSNACLYCSNVRLRGFNQGSIQFGNRASQLRFSDVTATMLDDLTLTTGGIYVQNTSTINTGDHLLSFDLGSSLTVDGSVLWYETLGAADSNNIRPSVAQDPYKKRLTLLNNGIIKTIKTLASGGLSVEYTYTITSLAEVSKGKPLTVSSTTTLSGENNTIIFSALKDPIISIAPGKTLTVQDVHFDKFSFDYVGFEGEDSHILFDNNTIISLDIKNYELNRTFTFVGECIINGNNGTLVFGPHAGFAVAPDSSLLIQNMTIKGLSDEQIFCMDNSGTVSFGGAVSLHLDDDYYFKQGSIELMPAAFVDVNESASFVYQSNRRSIINTGATLQMAYGAAFYYDPSINNRDLLVLADEDAAFSLYNGTLVSSTTGMRLTKGVFEIVGAHNYLENPGAISLSEGIMLGDAVDPDNNIYWDFDNGNVAITSGLLVWANILPTN
ncbi:MAG: hypothetical protein US69_C0023G0008 [candidate division TM6 bacterium GW2011_GWF2_38_10]|nr:MAG: hypothetical protein US69_C0023G0008 [candidate division TM6 bacterium GW2011_GWF2_38_10]